MPIEQSIWNAPQGRRRVRGNGEVSPDATSGNCDRHDQTMTIAVAAES